MTMVLRENLQICEFFKSRVSYCDEDGLHKSHDKVTAVAEAPMPENVTQLMFFLGLVNFYHRFIPNYSTVVAPLNELLQDNVTWEWSDMRDRMYGGLIWTVILNRFVAHVPDISRHSISLPQPQYIRRWYLLHIDFTWPFKNAMFLIVVDAHSKWHEVFHMTSTTADATIKVLRTLLARQLPCEVVSDNGPQFIAEELKTFMSQNGIRRIRSAPYHPRSNGQAKRFVQSFKRAIESADCDHASMNKKLCSFLCKYRVTPHATTNETSSMLMYGRNIRKRLDILKPDAADVVHEKQHVIPKHVGVNVRQFDTGDTVLVWDYRERKKWTKGRISSKTGPLSYKVDIGNGTIWRRHVDQMRQSDSFAFRDNTPTSTTGGHFIIGRTQLSDVASFCALRARICEIWIQCRQLHEK